MNEKTKVHALSIVEKQKGFVLTEKGQRNKNNQILYAKGMSEILDIFLGSESEEEKEQSALSRLNWELSDTYRKGMEEMLRFIISDGYSTKRTLQFSNSAYAYNF